MKTWKKSGKAIWTLQAVAKTRYIYVIYIYMYSILSGDIETIVMEQVYRFIVCQADDIGVSLYRSDIMPNCPYNSLNLTVRYQHTQDMCNFVLLCMPDLSK